VGNQDSPKGDKECSKCSLFQEVNAAPWSMARPARRLVQVLGQKDRLGGSGRTFFSAV
jgi:hypothetical protein